MVIFYNYFVIGLGTGSRIENRKVLQMFKYERRYLDRFEIPGAKIQYKLQNGNSAKVKLIDITKISARFYVKHKMSEDEIIELDIIVEGKEKITVKGHVVWILDNVNNNNLSAVVQFLPFGTDEKINTMKSYEQLAELAEEYLKEDKILKNIYKS